MFFITSHSSELAHLAGRALNELGYKSTNQDSCGVAASFHHYVHVIQLDTSQCVS